MKALMTGLIVIAVANLLAIAGFVGWLVQSDRLDMERVRSIRQKLAMTVTQERAEAAALEKKNAAAAAEAEAAAKAARPPLTASEQLAARLEATELDKERLSRLKREIDSLQKRLAEQADQLARDRAALDRDRKAFADLSTTTVETQTTEQFQKALGVLTSLKPAAAKAILAQMLTGALDEPGGAATPDGGAAAMNSAAAAAGGAPNMRPEQLKKVVQYLDAMEERPRTKIMTEFTKDDPAMAGRLLAELRDKGALPGSRPAPVKSAAANP